MKKTFCISILYIILSFACFVSCTHALPEDIPVSSVTLSQKKAELLIGESIQLSVSIAPLNTSYKDILWATTRPSVVSVTKEGLITAISEGTATITATVGDKSSSCEIIVSAAVIPVSSIMLNLTSLELNIGEKETLIATILPENASNRNVIWTSSDDDIASVNQNGQVTAKAGGTVSIIADVENKSATCILKCIVPSQSIVIDFSNAFLKVGQELQIMATVWPENASDKSVSWTSSNPDIATVDESGTVKAVSLGSTIIYATNGANKTECSISVVEDNMLSPEMVELGLSVKWASINLGASQVGEEGYYYSWGETHTKNYFDWGSYSFSGDTYRDFTKYCTKASYGKDGYVDDLTVLQNEDDAAYVLYGGKWRMPTSSEWRELLENCEWSVSSINGHKGYLVIGTKPGFTSNWIFLPQGKIVEGLGNSSSDEFFAYYWSSSLDTEMPHCSWALCFSEESVLMDTYNRFYGMQIRAVSE